MADFEQTGDKLISLWKAIKNRASAHLIARIEKKAQSGKGAALRVADKAPLHYEMKALYKLPFVKFNIIREFEISELSSPTRLVVTERRNFRKS